MKETLLIFLYSILITGLFPFVWIYYKIRILIKKRIWRRLYHLF